MARDFPKPYMKDQLLAPVTLSARGKGVVAFFGRGNVLRGGNASNSSRVLQNFSDRSDGVNSQVVGGTSQYFFPILRSPGPGSENTTLEGIGCWPRCSIAGRLSPGSANDARWVVRVGRGTAGSGLITRSGTATSWTRDMCCREKPRHATAAVIRSLSLDGYDWLHYLPAWCVERWPSR